MSLKYGVGCPVGTCYQRDVIRDAQVKEKMKEAYWDIIYLEKDPIDRILDYRATQDDGTPA